MRGGIDLHLHLDGSMTAKYLLGQAKKQGIALPTDKEEELWQYLKAPLDCENLNDYLTKFDLPLQLMQTEAALTEAVSDLCMRLKEQGLSYAEIRFAPQLHLQKGLTQEQVVKAVIRGLIKDEEFSAYLILCCMRMADNEAENLETIRLGSEYLGKGVVAVDLAGAEALFPTEQFEAVFKEAREKNLPFTIHAGEAAGAESIWKAIEFGAKRIGHGVHCLEDERLVAYLREHQIPLELCPSSNLQTKAVQGQYPVKEFLEQGLCVTINTDNMTVSDTTLKNEFEFIKKHCGLSEEQIEILKENAKRARFVNP